MHSADKRSTRAPVGSVRPAGSDFSDYQQLAADVDKLLADMVPYAEQYSDAKAILEYTEDRRKSALAQFYVTIRDQNPEEPAATIEQRARACKGYREALAQLQEEERTAEVVKNTYELYKIRVDVARSKMAVTRALIEIL